MENIHSPDSRTDYSCRPRRVYSAARGGRGSFARTVNSIFHFRAARGLSGVGWEVGVRMRRAQRTRRRGSASPPSIWIPAQTAPTRSAAKRRHVPTPELLCDGGMNSHFAEGERRRRREISHFSSALFGDSKGLSCDPERWRMAWTGTV